MITTYLANAAAVERRRAETLFRLADWGASIEDDRTSLQALRAGAARLESAHTWEMLADAIGEVSS